MSDDFGRDTLGGADSAGTLLLEEQAQYLEPGDHERFSHYVRKAALSSERPAFVVA